MKQKQATPAQFKIQAVVFKARARTGPLLMVYELSRGERCVCELAEMIGSEMSTVSKHLSQLKQAGIVDDEKRGAQSAEKATEKL